MAVAQARIEYAAGHALDQVALDEPAPQQRGERRQPGPRGMGVLGIGLVGPELGPAVAVEERLVAAGTALHRLVDARVDRAQALEAGQHVAGVEGVDPA